MRDAHGGVGGVDALAARAAGAVHIDAQVVLVDVDLDLIGLGQHRHRCGGGVDAALGLGLGNALYAMDAGLELHDRVHLVALDLELDFLVAARIGGADVHELDLPLARGAEALVHLEQVACEDGGLVTACRGADLHDDVLLIGRIGGNEQELDVLFQAGKLGLCGGDGLLSELLHVGVAEHLLGLVDVGAGLQVLAGLLHQLALVGVFLCQLVVFLLIGKHGRVAHLGLQLLVGLDDLLQLVAHFAILHGRCILRHMLPVAADGPAA